MKAARGLWRCLQPWLEPDRLVFVDETGTQTKMARRRGRAPRGQRLVAGIPHGHWKTITLVCALRRDTIAAPMVIDRAMNGHIFQVWVDQVLCPTLKPGDIVVWDNLPAHKVAAAEAAIDAVGASLLRLPPYSPDFNPIEQLFAKLKAHLRKAAARTVDQLWREIGRILSSVPPTECANYFRNAGYASV